MTTDEILTLFGAPPDGPVTIYEPATDIAAQAPKRDRVVSKIQAVDGFWAAEIASFETNH